MSRARPYTYKNEVIWFDKKAGKATAQQLELLSDLEEIEMDDILEEQAEGKLSQKEVLKRLHTLDNLIPPDVLRRRRERLERAKLEPACRICEVLETECEGRITRHHFVPKWIMRELSNYQAYAPRSRCTIPLCVGRHRDIHYRGRDRFLADKSITPYLRDTERKLAEKMLNELKDERPALYELLLSGDCNAYEWQLIRDFSQGRFRHTPSKQAVSDLDQAVGEG